MFGDNEECLSYGDGVTGKSKVTKLNVSNMWSFEY